jgi:hypothetical protein
MDQKTPSYNIIQNHTVIQKKNTVIQEQKTLIV